jgi:hypothetical protein
MFCLVGSTPITTGQIIPIKTVPLATGNQFSIFPSENLASGGISIAADDALLDPFQNPAKAVKIESIYILSAPQMYSISMQRGTSEGSGKSLPLGLVLRNGEYFGGLYWARQELATDRNATIGIPQGSSGFFQEDPENNTYTFALLGTSLPDFNLAVGASVLWGELSSVEGVKLLFPRSPVVLQNGSLAQYRLGIAREMKGDERFDAVLVRSVFKMRYDVGSFPTWPGRVPQLQFNPEYDQTNLWGLRLRYTRPLALTWRIGALFTTNWKDHPKIPNYELMSIPRDPGNSTAYNLGIGLFSEKSNSFFGVDLIYEPITTATWAEADRPIPLPGNQIFPAGMKTVENFFDFSNWIVKTGFKIGGERSGFQAGLHLHSISYDLEQINHLQRSKRNQHESWVEWTLSAGYGFTIGPARIHYTGMLTSGTGQPGVVSAGWTGTARAGVGVEFLSGDFLPAPSGALNLREALVWTHLVSVSYRID